MVGCLKRNGHDRVAVLSEISPNGEEYFCFLRQECRRRAPCEHEMFRGEWLLYGRVNDGKLEFEGLGEPWD